ncbi:MAG: DUF4040 domain-containing protein, partial [Acidimicrobiia bacterium]|nr:DUF4040 domain-containing protein [Acidimicrobiia bacterium]
KPAVAVSAAVIVGGVLVHWRRDLVGRRLDRVGSVTNRLPSSEGSYRGAVSQLNAVADRVTGFFQNGSLPVYLAVILTTATVVPTVAWVASGTEIDLQPFSVSTGELALAALGIVAAIAATRASSRLVAVLLLGAVGYSMAGLFVVYAAPDLALTLLLVETITVAIFAFVLSKVPRGFEMERGRITGALRLGIALGVGVFVAGAALVASRQRVGENLAETYAQLAPEAGGSNVVNVILTDFRALDTLGEITVLAVAAIGVTVLVRGLRTTSDGEQ